MFGVDEGKAENLEETHEDTGRLVTQDQDQTHKLRHGNITDVPL